jgi:hypothetical protein
MSQKVTAWIIRADIFSWNRLFPPPKENDVRMACHPYDPPGLPFGYQGVWWLDGCYPHGALESPLKGNFERSM